ncbi:GDSL esterase/lipase [Sesamum alatum]|uniref:GDSL esterase/lipase n=1 Tax=Sesamum alatum TaxID=300844 RepID=A0AAE1XUJ4_9LAMI|nr:GDSL esterase/lipase [Sesamum alatum]
MEGRIANSRLLLFVAFVLVSLASDVIARRIPAAPPCDFPAIYNFGDSNSDTGGISAAFWRIPPPYGVSYFRRPAGRNSDGRLIIDFIAEHLGVPYLSSYLDSIGTNFRHGANFATGGSTIRRQNESIFENGISPFSLDIQTMQFDQFRARTGELYHPGELKLMQDNHFSARKLPRPKEFSRALYTFDIGQNDIAAGFRKLTMPQLRAAIPDIVDQFGAAVTRLYQQGARAFWIHNTGPIGCLPAAMFYVRNLNKPGFFDKYGCIRSHNAIALEFNRQLKARVTTLRAELPHAALTYVDIYSAKYHLISNTKIYGFSNPFKICCGHHKNNVHVWCGQRVVINSSEILGASCGSPATCISWDGVHYSQAANQWIANHIANGSFSDPPMPVANACFKR